MDRPSVKLSETSGTVGIPTEARRIEPLDPKYGVVISAHAPCANAVPMYQQYLKRDWNPAILGQQIGRVDRKGSLWEDLARRWLDGDADGTPSFIEIRQLVFEGTYDAYKWNHVGRRQREFDASLFGARLPHEAWERVPSDRRGTLVAAAPSFAPPTARPLEPR